MVFHDSQDDENGLDIDSSPTLKMSDPKMLVKRGSSLRKSKKYSGNTHTHARMHARKEKRVICLMWRSDKNVRTLRWYILSRYKA